MRTILITIITLLLICSTVQAAGWTVWGLTEQLTTVENDNTLTGRVGYMLGQEDTGGLELFTGSIWRPRLDDAPQVITFGAVQHMPDLLDPNESIIPYIPQIMKTIISDDISARSYFGGEFSANVVDKDAGQYALIAGVNVKLREDDISSLVFELQQVDTFGDLGGVDDGLKAYMGFRIPF